MRDAWLTTRLKYIAACNSNVLPETTDEGFEFRYVDIGNVTQGSMDLDTNLIQFSAAPSRARRLATTGDSVVSTVRTYLRAVATVPESTEPLVFSTGFAVLQPRQDVCPAFLSYYLQSDEFVDRVVAHSDGVSYPAITASRLVSLHLRLPPREEQQPIADYLDRETAHIDALIAKQEALIETLRERRRAVLHALVTQGLNPKAEMTSSGVQWLGSTPQHWVECEIKWLTKVKRGASPRPIDDPKYFDDQGDWSWVRISDVTAAGPSGKLRQTTQRLSELGSTLSARLLPGSLFLSIAGSVGKPCINEIPACVHDGFVYFPDLAIDPMWLFRIFEMGDCYGGLGKLGTQLNLNTDTVGSIAVPVPPADEIDEILVAIQERTDKIDTLISKTEQFITLAKERRAALITAAVTGQINVEEAA